MGTQVCSKLLIPNRVVIRLHRPLESFRRSTAVVRRNPTFRACVRPHALLGSAGKRFRECGHVIRRVSLGNTIEPRGVRMYIQPERVPDRQILSSQTLNSLFSIVVVVHVTTFGSVISHFPIPPQTTCFACVACGYL